jgi:uncharacterized protein YaiL (DUF2058 family)
MSLRDAMLKAGVVDKKKVQDVNRQLKQERKADQGARERKWILEAKEAEERQRAKEEHERQVIEARRAREAERGAQANALRVRQLLRRHRLHVREGGTAFYVRSLDGQKLLRLNLPVNIARDLRGGRLALAALEPSYGGPPDYFLITRDVALRVLESQGALPFFNEHPAPDTPDQQLLQDEAQRAELGVDELLAWVSRRAREPKA